MLLAGRPCVLEVLRNGDTPIRGPRDCSVATAAACACCHQPRERYASTMDWIGCIPWRALPAPCMIRLTEGPACRGSPAKNACVLKTDSGPSAGSLHHHPHKASHHGVQCTPITRPAPSPHLPVHAVKEPTAVKPAAVKAPAKQAVKPAPKPAPKPVEPVKKAFDPDDYPLTK